MTVAQNYCRILYDFKNKRLTKNHQRSVVYKYNLRYFYIYVLQSSNRCACLTYSNSNGLFGIAAKSWILMFYNGCACLQ